MIEKRIARAKEELPVANQYDYIVLNDELEDAVADFFSILRAEAMRPEQTDLSVLMQEEKG